MRTPRVTQHLLTNSATVQKFLPVAIQISGGLGEPGGVEVVPRP
jgi:RNA 3'-terminal phosphate cyclase